MNNSSPNIHHGGSTGLKTKLNKNLDAKGIEAGLNLTTNTIDVIGEKENSLLNSNSG